MNANTIILITIITIIVAVITVIVALVTMHKQKKREKAMREQVKEYEISCARKMYEETVKHENGYTDTYINSDGIEMLILTITEPNVDGCNTDVSTNLLVDTHGRLSDDEYALLESNVKNNVRNKSLFWLIFNETRLVIPGRLCYNVT